MNGFDIPRKTARVERYWVRLRSSIHRSADRAIRGGQAAGSPRNPRPDNVVMAAWVERSARRAGACPVDAAEWNYDPGFTGPHAIQTATVRCLIPANEAERELFSHLRLDPHVWTLDYYDPEYRHEISAV